MPRRNLVKTCAIAGCVLALAFMLYVVLAPNIPQGKTRMIIPEMMIPKAPPGVAPGTPPPLDVKIKRILVGAIFMGPFGLMVGTGVGLLLEGLRQALRRKGGETRP
jgi:hypothetical protein